LWPFAVSGDLPIVLITIGEERDISLVRQMLKAHTFWRMHGLSSDLVILNEEAGSYERPLQERLERLIHAHSLSGSSARPGGIFLKSAAHIPVEDLDLLKAALPGGQMCADATGRTGRVGRGVVSAGDLR